MKDNAITTEIVTLHLPLRLQKRGGRKAMELPEGAVAKRTQPDDALIKALARGFRWKRILESGVFTTINELAAHEKITPTYMTRVMRLTLLPPKTVEAIVAGQQASDVTLARLLEPFPIEWRQHSERFR